MPEERYSEAKALLERRKNESIPWFANPLKYSETNSEGYALVERKHESTTIELFYDLFFVANLTTFTYVHEINDVKSFRSYTGFFTLIWFTWLQTALFDCRFARDSVLERFFKFVQFGVMIGFAAIGSKFRPNEVNTEFKSYRAVSVILLISQLLLAVQYLTILIAVIKRKHKNAITPLALIIGIYFVTAFVFFGLAFTFKKKPANGGGKTNKAYVAWYIGLILETVAITGVSLWRRILSFKYSNIVERMGLLTLIILGEGVIGLAKTANKIIYKEGWTLSAAYETTAYILTIFFMWMLYFDNNPRTHYGSIRQQIWALLHYPFHLACVLLPEGFGNMVVWRNIVNDLVDLERIFVKASDAVLEGFDASAVTDIIKRGTQKLLKIDDSTQEWSGLQVILDEWLSAGNETEAMTLGQKYGLKASELIFKGFKVPLPEQFVREKSRGVQNADDTKILEQYVKIFELVYAYFFGAAAIVVLLYAVFLFLARKKRDRYDNISIMYRIFVAIGLLATTLITFHNESLYKIMLSPWFIPIAPFSLGIVIAADRLLHFIAIRSAEKHFKQVNARSGKHSPESIDTHYNPTTNSKPMYSPQPARAEDVGQGYYPMTDMGPNMIDERPVQDPRATHGSHSGHHQSRHHSKHSSRGRGYGDV